MKDIECELQQDDFVVIFKAFYERYISKSDKYYPPRCSDITHETCSRLAGAKKITQKSRRDLSTLDFFASFLHQGKNEEAVGMTGNDIVGGTMVSGVSGGVGSMLAGGDFGQGFQSGAYRHLYNDLAGDVQGAIKDFYMKKFALTSNGFLDWHYFRNANNDSNKATIKLDALASMYHGKGNLKYVSPDGHNEAVYNKDRQLVGGRNRGTYNYVSYQNGPGHFVLDMVPYFILGN